ncbi:hypothetical protein H9L10_03820 [Phycicoccus endophyticus]|uniref:LPXTG cell wall anchor domain-containing protein n=1 Tax=Phycicoccus endophyticus TaxID=1690220 RepID=A0A7G9R3L5_9MICO|nr:hypothetical protein [Phycicoccus endophyticus]QNN50190.1 hypothetical protein H9L10_03820 [Phycicoccus endophyticus]GGL27208.1 hypothetical protein GCM10012283_06800 [Phycicoccus endophyticus]
MGGGLRRAAGAVATGVLAGAGLLVTAAPATAAACAGSSGVSVVVDTGSAVTTRCAPGDPASALEALEAVASVVQVETQPGFLCRVDGVPASAGCVRTPPADAYWGFFHAAAGEQWTYSDTGVATFDPPAGSVIGVRYGAGERPRVAVADVLAGGRDRAAGSGDGPAGSTAAGTSSAPGSTTSLITGSALVVLVAAAAWAVRRRRA